MILEVDAGNTLVKWRLRDGLEIRQRGSYERNNDFSIEITEQQMVESIYVSSVADLEYENVLTQNLLHNFSVFPWFARSSTRCAGVCNSYEDPSLMGVDRWLAMLAAYNDCSGAVCVIDVGSALTIDFVMTNGMHRGGYILAGTELIKSTLLKNTDRVRFEKGAVGSLEPGSSTLAAVNNGVLLSHVGSVKLALEQIGQSEGHEFSLYFCGGDGRRLQEALAVESSYNPELVLDGLSLAAADV